MRFDLVLANLTAWARTTGVVKVLSDGTPWRPLVHVRDMAHAILCAVEAPEAVVSGGAFNIGRQDNNVQVSDIAEMVRRQVPGSRVAVTGEAGGDPRSYRVDFSVFFGSFPASIRLGRWQWAARRSTAGSSIGRSMPSRSNHVVTYG